MSRQVLTSQGVALNVAVDGPDDAPWLVLSNSLGANLDMWLPQLPALAREWRVLRYDTRGHGRSAVPPAPYAIDDLGRDVIGLLDALGIERAHYCGVSLGGVTGLWLAAHAPERIGRLVACNTVPWFGAPAAMDERIAAVRAHGIEPLVEATLARWFTPSFHAHSPEVVAAIRSTLLATPVEGYVGCCAALRDLDLRAALPQLRVPTLAVAGTHDPSPPPSVLRAWAAQIPGAQVVELDAAHLSNVGAAAEFNAAVAGFLRGSD